MKSMSEPWNGELIRLEGDGGFINADSLIEPGWLKDMLTLEEYRSAIAYVNPSPTRCHGNFPCSLIVGSLSDREKAEGGKYVVGKINRRHKSVRFVYQQGLKEMI